MNNISISPEVRNDILNKDFEHTIAPETYICSRQAAINAFIEAMRELDKRAGSELTGAYKISFSVSVIPTENLGEGVKIPTGSDEETATLTQTQYDIIHALSEALDKIYEVPLGIFVIFGSWGDTLPDTEILDMAKGMKDLI